MKKLRLLKTINTLLVIALTMTLLLVWLVVGGEFVKKYWYVFVVGFYAIMLLFKYFLFGSDNVLWFALCLILFTAYMVLFHLQLVEFSSYPLLVLIPSFISLLVFLIYKNILHLSLFILFLFNGWPLFLMSLKLVNNWWFLLISTLSSIVGLVIINVIYYNYKR